MHSSSFPLVLNMVDIQLAVCVDHLLMVRNALQSGCPEQANLSARASRIYLQVKTARSHLLALKADLMELHNPTEGDNT